MAGTQWTWPVDTWTHGPGSPGEWITHPQWRQVASHVSAGQHSWHCTTPNGCGEASNSVYRIPITDPGGPSHKAEGPPLGGTARALPAAGIAAVPAG